MLPGMEGSEIILFGMPSLMEIAFPCNRYPIRSALAVTIYSDWKSVFNPPLEIIILGSWGLNEF